MGSAPGSRRTILAVACVFLANGFIIGAWGVRVVEVQRAHGHRRRVPLRHRRRRGLGACDPGGDDRRLPHGPALIGLLTTALSLPGALCSLVVAMGVVLLLARQVGVADEV